jgi:hypothetical protein
MQQTQIQHSVYHTSAEIAAAAHAFPFFAQGENTFGKHQRFAPAKDKAWPIARSYQKFVTANYTPQDAAALYFERYPDHPPDKFYSSEFKREAAAKRALQPAGWATKLIQRLDHPNTRAYFYTLSVDNLGLNPSYADPRFMYYPLIVEEFKAALRKLLPAPFTWKLEVGTAGNAHLHAVAGYAPALDYLMGSERMKPIQPGTELTVLAYLEKPVAPWTPPNYANYLQAQAEKQTRTLPRLSGQIWNFARGKAV